MQISNRRTLSSFEELEPGDVIQRLAYYVTDTDHHFIRFQRRELYGGQPAIIYTVDEDPDTERRLLHLDGYTTYFKIT